MFRPFVVVLAFAAALTSIAGCTNDNGTTTPSTSTSIGRGRDSGAAVGEVEGTRRGDVGVDALVGAEVSFDARVKPDALGPGGNLASAFKVGSKIVVWMRVADEPAGVETSAQFGYAEVRSIDADGAKFAVTGRVPGTLWRREQRMMPLVEVATTAGTYEVALQGFFTQRVRVRTSESIPASTTTEPRAVPDASKLLGVRDLAGVAFGLDEVSALPGLTKRFGKPSFDDVRTGPCGAERLVGWGSLMVTFRDPSVAGAGPGRREFTAYVYSAPHAGVTEGPMDLRTASGVAPGSSLAELEAREPGVVFVTDQVGYAATTWYAATGSRLAGRISDDVSAAGVTVVEIASSLASRGAPTYPGC